METIYAIPGLGNTKELYRNIHVPGHRLQILDWPEPEANGSLGDYAKKFIPQIEENKQPVKLLGVSFGGMICSELAELLQVKKTVLISSCCNRRQFPLTLNLLRYVPIYRFVPDNTVRLLAKIKRKYLGFEKSFEPVFYQMIDSMPKNYFSRCISYIINWNRTQNSAPMVQIHGTGDRLLKNHQAAAYKIPGGSHAMVLSRAQEINNLLDKEFNGL